MGIKDNEEIIIIVETNNGFLQLKSPVNISLMTLLKINKANIEAICGGNLACSTCMVDVEESWFHKIPGPSEDELALLDTAPTSHSLSRLSCQIILNNSLNGLKIKIP